MSDIVERLRITESDGKQLPLHDLRYEAAYEIERLRELRDTMLEGEVAIRQRDADEIEQLYSQLAAMERGYKSFRDTAEAEFERLRAANKKQANMICEQEADIERLRMLLREAIGTWQPDFRARVREALGE